MLFGLACLCNKAVLTEPVIYPVIQEWESLSSQLHTVTPHGVYVGGFVYRGTAACSNLYVSRLVEDHIVPLRHTVPPMRWGWGCL